MSGTTPLSVVVVDDSLTTRALIVAALKRDCRVKVVGTAGTPFEARDLIVRLNPDVLTLDFEMPSMNGLQFLEKIMRLRPMPVVMVSGHLSSHKGLVEQALRMGAAEWYSKMALGSGEEPFAGLGDAIVRAAGVKGPSPPSLGGSAGPRNVPGPKTEVIVGIGASTGGVEALTDVLEHFPVACPPTVIVQHMPRQFSESFARRLNRLVKPEVRLAEDGDVLKPGTVYVASGGERHLRVRGGGRPGEYVCQLIAGPPVNGHRPSVDELFYSLARTVGKDAVGVILTGMECDGAQGLLAMRHAGACTIGQDRATSVIYGMPRAAFELGAVEAQLPLSAIGPAILNLCERRSLETYP
ncbi:protein-glutamate methylesterase/protein-glutamine glutaminase [Gluconobacter sp.]|uniref:protein-glutamate methylesterase/protein-glutamine glutaminase n=1 Tax=Gluconobacter sp. TaxID=1876758 RepID=UPI0039EB8153